MTESSDFDPDKERGPIAWMAKNAVASNVLMLTLIVGGIVTLASGAVRQEVFPEVELDVVSISVIYPGASPAEVEQAVVLAVEEAVRGIDGVKKVTSTAMEGQASTLVELLLGTDKDRALNDVKSTIDRITSFPEDVERPTVSLLSNRQQVISLVLYGDVDEATLRSVAENSRRELLQDSRITYVELSGIRPLEISIEVPQTQLRKHGLTLDEVAARVRAASVELPGGGVKTRGGEVLLRTTERRDSGHEFGDIVLLSQPDGSQVRVRDVATVRDGFREVDKEATYNGKRAVMINVYRVGDETPLTVSAAAKEYVAKLQQTLPEGLSAAPWFDTAEMYEGRLSLLLGNARIGLVLVLLTLGLFLEARLAFWVTLGIPVSFAGSLLFFPAADVSINMISLFAFIVTLGMVVDDAIVIGEATYQLRMEGKGRLQAAIQGTKEVAQPVIFAILTTCVAFAPMLMVPGPMGKFFRTNCRHHGPVGLARRIVADPPRSPLAPDAMVAPRRALAVPLDHALGGQARHAAPFGTPHPAHLRSDPAQGVGLALLHDHGGTCIARFDVGLRCRPDSVHLPSQGRRRPDHRAPGDAGRHACGRNPADRGPDRGCRSIDHRWPL
jgi:multidrug efflux pump subunit AcrB